MTVTVYSKPACPQCDATYRQLDKSGINYRSIDVTADHTARDLVTALGYTSAPVVVAGDDHWAGFRPDRIRALGELVA
jgi:glutaredoxin-like protein NrdH